VTGQRKTVCKVRGINFKYRTSQLVNFDGIKDMTLNTGSGNTVTVHTDKKI